MRELLANNIHEKISTSTNKKTSDFSLANMFKEQDLYRKMYQENSKKEEDERKNIDKILAEFISNKQNKEEKNHSKKSNFEDINSNKEKLLEYSKLADLAYIELKTDNTKKWNDKYKFETVKLDPLIFPNIESILSWKKFNKETIWNLTNEEKELYNFINNKENISLIKDYSIKDENEKLLTNLWLQKDYLVENENKEIISKESYLYELNKKRFLLDRYLDSKWIIKEPKENFEKLKQDYNILDYFPNETKLEKWWSWFWALLLEKWWKKIISIRWTEISDFWDLKEDWKLFIKKFPDKQARDLVKFIDRTIKSWEEFSIVWHSLWWALSQIATSIYANQVKETYTFNSPWVKNIKVSEEDKLKIAKLRNFEYNKEKAREKITNVRWDSWIKPVADLWEDLWNYEIVFKNLFSHLITDTILYIEKLDNNSEELKIIKIKKIREKNPKSKK